MDFTQRIFAYLKFQQLLTDLHGEPFEEFFHRLMGARYPDYVPVRTHGKLGDMGADGLLLFDRTLHACYAPETHGVSAFRSKLRSDLKKALAKRNGQFDTFAFVHNDARGGVHPQVSVLLSETQELIRPLRWRCAASSGSGRSSCASTGPRPKTFSAARSRSTSGPTASGWPTSNHC